MQDAPPSHGAPSFSRFWTAATLSSFGTAVTTVAMPVLVVTTLEASAFEVGVVNAAQFLPYAALGLVAGVYADRWRRQRILVWSSVGRAITLGAIPVLWALDALQVWPLVGLLLLFGSFSVFAFAATQSLLPRIVPRERLVVANARLDQSDAAAQTLGPALGGGLVGLLGAPVAIAVDAVSYLLDALLNAGLRVTEPPVDASTPRNLRREIGEGLRFTYRHRTLAPLALSTHVWFLANGAGFTALSLVALREMALSSLVFGLLVTVAGSTGLVGASIAPSLGRRIGAGPAIVRSRAVYPVAWLLVALAPTVSTAAGVALLTVALGLHGLAGGLENANDMGLWRRSVNRTSAAVGALLGGTAVAFLGASPALLGVAVVFTVAVAVAGLSPLREVRQVL
ncbi:hypothetical protein NPS01_32230 [Nocardioides psychrotolerans]|uniref:MFS-type transporter involved in bile tolerance, Atg22 family n=1 Tax=Nocardioides psychrotolerans TaxID=1005945 RepID=A0A1I3P281_9ACTN|nr:MFS transporter [Nocardioides psychrotolerans]GEP39560.1 hypothetical protein NPS01_32230 [Nocardioides psychrotolerans]SFJ15156.1 MFS-type transporter involved in bile tolerance, Atg22 family [Nocardioides psychrotolerans]